MAKITASKGTTTNKAVKATPAVMTTTTAAKPATTEFKAQYRPSHDEIAMRAYTIWQNKGCPIGHDADDWFEAERQLIQGQRNVRR